MMNFGKDSIKGFLFSLGGTVLGATCFVTAKYGLQGFNPETFTLVWTSAATVFAGCIAVACRPSRKGLLPRHAMQYLLILGICTAIGMTLGWKGLVTLDPSFASFLWRLVPILTILCGVVFLKERLTFKEMTAGVIMICGGLVSVFGRWDLVGSGVTLSLVACLASVGQLLVAKSQTHKVHPNVLVAYRAGIGTALILAWVLVTGSADLAVAPRYWFVTILGAFLAPCCAFLCLFRAYRYWTLSQTSLVIAAQPLFVLPLAYLFLGILPTTRELVGGCIILVGGFWLACIQIKKTNR